MDELVRSDVYQQMVTADRDFVKNHGRLIGRRAALWAGHPMQQWSRRWEYPYVAQQLERSAAGRKEGRPLTVLDAGSGVTFFPYYLCERIGGVEVICCDADERYVQPFARLAEATGNTSVRFIPAMLQELPLEDDSLDAITCISVLEHTGRYVEILAEFDRVLRPGGLLALTFDISPDGRTDIHPEVAKALVAVLMERFDLEGNFDALGELAKLQQPEDILTTDYVKQTDPSRLPWKWPLLKSIYDLCQGRGWTGGFFSLTFYCIAVRARSST